MTRVAKLFAAVAVTSSLLLVGCGSDSGGKTGVDMVVGGNDVAPGVDKPPVGNDVPPGMDRPPTGNDVAPPPADAPPAGDMVTPPPTGNTFRMSKLTVDQAGAAASAANTTFPSNVTLVLGLSLSGQGVALGIPTLNIVATLSSTAPGPTMVTVCQADNVTNPMGAPSASDHFKCRMDPAPVSTLGTIDASLKLTTMPKDFTFSVDAAGAVIPLTLKDFALAGTIDDQGRIGQMDGALTSGLLVSDLCNVTLMAAALGMFCNGNTTVNLLDWVDGDNMGCGQDDSADWKAMPPTCATSMDAATHNPPDINPGMPDAEYTLTGKFAMNPAIIDP